MRPRPGTPTEQRRRLRERLITALLVAGSLALAMALGEGALRAVAFRFRAYNTDDIVVPGCAGRAGWNRREAGLLQINSQGLRDR